MEPIKFHAQIMEIKSRPDGTIRLLLDTGSDSLEAIQKLLKLHSKGDCLVALAMVPFTDDLTIPELDLL